MVRTLGGWRLRGGAVHRLQGSSSAAKPVLYIRCVEKTMFSSFLGPKFFINLKYTLFEHGSSFSPRFLGILDISSIKNVQTRRGDRLHCIRRSGATPYPDPWEDLESRTPIRVLALYYYWVIPRNP